MIYYLQHDPDKALLFGNEYIKENISTTFRERMQFYIGVSELLKDDILESKDYFVQTLQKGEETDITRLAMIENNLAVACWWDRYPNY